MPLPNLEKMVPTFPITIPSTGKDIVFRPFLVKEEKLLLIALESGEDKAMLDAIIQVITACAITPLKVDLLANFDIEYIFLQLRARSINNIVDQSYKCHNPVPCSLEEFIKYHRRQPKVEENEETEKLVRSCDSIVPLSINLDDVKVQFNDEHTKQIYLTDTLGVNMRYPNYKMTRGKEDLRPANSITDTLQRIAMCIESVFDGESVYTGFTPKEIAEWIEKLTQEQFLKVENFFETMPILSHDVMFDCPVCGYHEAIHLEGLASFFG